MFSVGNARRFGLIDEVKKHEQTLCKTFGFNSVDITHLSNDLAGFVFGHEKSKAIHEDLEALYIALERVEKGYLNLKCNHEYFKFLEQRNRLLPLESGVIAGLKSDVDELIALLGVKKVDSELEEKTINYYRKFGLDESEAKARIKAARHLETTTSFSGQVVQVRSKKPYVHANMRDMKAFITLIRFWIVRKGPIPKTRTHDFYRFAALILCNDMDEYEKIYEKRKANIEINYVGGGNNNY